MIVSRSSNSLPTPSIASPFTPQRAHSCPHGKQTSHGKSESLSHHRKWTLGHAVLASLVLLLNLQIMARHWNAAYCHVVPPVLVDQGHGRSLSHNDRTEPIAQSLVANTDDSHVRREQAQRAELSTKQLEKQPSAPIQKEASSDGIMLPTTNKPRILHWEGIDAMRYFAQTYFNGSNIFCNAMERERSGDDSIPVTLHISFGCQELFHHSGYGTGNYISFVYGLRLAAAVHTNVGLNLTCHDAESTRSNLILPWLTGWFPPRSVASPNPFPLVSTQQACSPYRHTQISRLYREMQHDFRRMAIGLVGLPNDRHHPSVAFAQTYVTGPNEPDASVRQVAVTPTEPVLPTVQLDDAVIHFRCGDLMDSNHGNFAFLKFDSYTRDISPHARSIGIITQPFPRSDTDPVGQVRGVDTVSDKVFDRCRTVVLALVDYIQERHPHARVTIHNGPSETIALAYARMVMANQTIAGISTFGVFPVLSTFGTGYLHQPQGPFVNGWMFHPRLDELASNLHIVRDQHYIMVADIKKLWESKGADGVLAWFTDSLNAVATPSAVKPNGVKPLVGSAVEPRVVSYNGLQAMQTFIQTLGESHMYCERIASERSESPQLPLTMKIDFGCDELFRESGYGTGNFVSLYYSLRLATAVHTNVGMSFTCHDAETMRKDLVFPWLTGWFPPRPVDSENPVPMVSVKGACGTYNEMQISRYYQEIQHDFRRMAIGLVGLPDDNPNHPSVAFAQQYLSSEAKTSPTDPVHHVKVNLADPIFPKGSVQLDDVAIHFRCGDLMDSEHGNFAFLKFDSYTRDISPDARSIGIITQPFPKNKGDGAVGQTRGMDTASKKVFDRCRTVVLALVDYIQERHPKSRVTIHNGPSETIALAYARLVMANQTIAGISTFGVFPVLSTFGTGYLHQPQGPFVNGWMFHPRLDELASNLHIVRDQHYIMVADIKKLWEAQGADGVLAWFKDETRPSKES